MRNVAKPFSNGAWVVLQAADTSEVLGPAPQRTIRNLPMGHEAEAAVTAANATFSGWSMATPKHRPGLVVIDKLLRHIKTLIGAQASADAEDPPSCRSPIEIEISV